MAKSVLDPLDTILDNPKSSFGENLQINSTITPPFPSKIIGTDADKPATKALRHLLRSQKPPKIKPKSIKTYILEELAILDECWGEADWQYQALQLDSDMDVDDLEDSLEAFMVKIEGAIDALFQLGRYFGISSEEMNAARPNSFESEYEDPTLLAQNVIYNSRYEV